MGTVTANGKAEKVLSKYEGSFNNNIAILMNAKKGLRPQAVFDFISLSELSNLLVEKALNKTLKTFIAYKTANTTLDPIVSEKLLKLFSLYDKGLTVFGNAREFNKWMAEPAFGLGNLVPGNLLDTITGIELITEELTRIAYGDLA
jgi:putative toxin-antitoxin system antitoxin component (TIGR02293 family)